MPCNCRESCHKNASTVWIEGWVLQAVLQQQALLCTNAVPGNHSRCTDEQSAGGAGFNRCGSVYDGSICIFKAAAVEV